jgi:hypothetical protein
MVTGVAAPLRRRLATRGALLARQFDWSATARAHLPAYRGLVELQHA